MDERQIKSALQAAVEAIVGKMNSTGDAYREFDADLDDAIRKLIVLLKPNN